ncbi:hypothetical protein KVP10_08405 [Candidimonas humi]|uniref:Uncharacterized protein n=1 Tax=Candidimonas humi TaxID=683355 RepID=A0ABV8NXP2_9BURK|nr:hypothetical protein [Candidimonas humi]MBV6304907.1 hypothetical protein [Candidimonas humi]
MQVKSQKTKLSLLAHYVDQWRIRAGSRETVATEIVQAHMGAGYNTRAKLTFETSGDAFMLAKSRADRIFRWLDDKSKDGNFMPVNFEDSIVLAMPEDLRLGYLNEWLRQFGMVTRGLHELSEDAAPSQLLPGLIKESSEATLALASLPENPSMAQLEAADLEFAEAIEELQKGRAVLQAKRKLKAVA